ncbi:origin recognition complex subunit 4, putative (macronuclear) [Tetrahymena thermophila SB210]|uniref:Origin recognition complex subunit 4, putative n=1 Tax=Tetrahymena thermophila (strain SB210) TaxID=312017 RepID=I7LWZ0_TETTS|nr:origin recognition complex subunit 4, putative [Tetrahymena thermophila SB210]EAS03119.2 origin recognition complex subunit 4, putative [Tetrahymena thermophila SB210]|eukprot:XP_001023364.2 origin recognition complex subunit 4, putative [Tetrahymena thermophila SB210]
MEEENTFEQQLKTIQKKFKKIDSGIIVKLGEIYNTLLNTLKASAHSATRSNIILYGLPGSGRKSAVRYAISEIFERDTMRLIPIWIDAGVFQTENEFALELVRQIKAQIDEEVELSKNDIFDQSFTFKNIEGSLNSQDGIWVLIVDRIENLVSQKRQSVLYALLDWLLNNQNRLTLIGITSDLKFSEKLEKRVKSRFSADHLHCMGYEIQDCVQLIKKRFEKIGDTESCQKLSQQLLKCFDSKDIQKLLDLNIVQLMKPIQYVLNVMSTMLNLIDCRVLENKIKTNFLSQYVHDLLQQALDLHQPFTGLMYVENLSEAEKQVLICVARLIQHEKYPITFNAIQNEITQHRKRMQQGTHIFFTSKVLQKATENLIQLKILRLQDNEEAEANGKLDETKNIILLVDFQQLRSYLFENADKLPESLKDLAEV